MLTPRLTDCVVEASIPAALIEIDEKLQGTRFRQLMDQAPDVKTLLHKRGKEVLYSIDPNLILQVGDILVVEGLVETLRRLSARFKS